jgi:hypothetical protein
MNYLLAACSATLLLLGAGRRPYAGRIEVAHDLARLTPSQAELLEGKRAKYGVVLDSLPDWHEGFVLYDCLS